MQSYEFYWDSGLLSEDVNEILFHFLVYITIAGESLAALFVAGECPDKIRVFHLLVDIADEGTTGEMTACNLVDMSFLLNACRGIQHCYNTVDATLCKYLFDSIVVLLRTDKWQEHTFTFNARIAFKYIFGALIERHTKHLRAFPFGFVRDIFNSTVNNSYIRIHPFEDGNGRIARLMVNYILTRHNYPMIVVRSRKKSEYLEALHRADLEVGPVPSDGAHADTKDIRPFLKYFNELVATEVYNDVLFVSEKNENVWWYDGERIAFRTPNYTKILNAMRTQPTLTLADMKEETGISITAIQKLLDQLISKKYVERGEKEGSWRVFLTQ